MSPFDNMTLAEVNEQLADQCAREFAELEDDIRANTSFRMSEVMDEAAMKILREVSTAMYVKGFIAGADLMRRTIKKRSQQ